MRALVRQWGIESGEGREESVKENERKWPEEEKQTNY